MLLQVETVLAEVQPGPRDPPRLLSTGSLRDGNLSIYCYLDSTPFFSDEDPLHALLLLLSSYFVGGVKWPKHTRLPLLLLSCATVGSTLVAAEVSSNNKFTDIITELGLM